MHIIIHDLPPEQFGEMFAPYVDAADRVKIISDQPDRDIKSCIGCFSCWVASPGVCALRDDFSGMGKLFSQADKISVISSVSYGCYSPFVKNVLDRSLPYQHPCFTRRGGEMHHRRRYDNRFSFRVFFYGDITEEERIIAEKLVKANSMNLGCEYTAPQFFAEAEMLRGVTL